MKKLLALLLCSIIFLSVPLVAFADDVPAGVIQVGCNSSSGGEVAYADITLYFLDDPAPIDSAYEQMWGPFTLYVHDGNGALVQQTVFDGPYMYLEFTEPGDYYISIQDKFSRTQGRFYDQGDGTLGYDRSPIHLKVADFSAILEPNAAIDFDTFLGYASAGERDAALREWLVFLHLNGLSHKGYLAELDASLAEYGDENLRECYDLLLQNDGYVAMAESGPMIYDYEMLREDKFWKYEFWRFAADGGEIPPDVMGAAEYDDYAYFEEYMGRTEASDAPLGEDAVDSAEDGAAGGAAPYALIGGGAAAVIAAAALLLKRKKK